MTNKADTYRIVNEVLLRLQLLDVKIGVDTHVYIQQLLEDDVDPEHLATLIAPVLVHHPDQQELFYQIWEETIQKQKRLKQNELQKPPLLHASFIDSLSTPLDDQAIKRDTKKKLIDLFSNNGLWLSIIALLVISIALLSWWTSSSSATEQAQITNLPEDIVVVDTSGVKVEDQTTSILEPLSTEEPLPWKTIPIAPISLNQFQQVVPSSVFERWIRQNPTLTKSLLMILVAFFALFTLYWRRQKRRFMAKKDTGENPPFQWNFSPDVPEILSHDEGIFLLNQQMKKREVAGVSQLDLHATIHATVQQSGLLSPIYKSKTRPSEYLLLIDRRSSKNHQAQLFDTLYKKMRKEEVLAERFFYDHDPRVCWNEQYPRGLGLPDLLVKFPSHQVLVFGTGYAFLNKRSGKLSKWVQILEGWEKKALITPRQTDSWGLKESQLHQVFRIFPSGVYGLQSLIEGLEKEESISPKTWTQMGLPEESSIQLSGEDLLNDLRRYYDDLTIKWIAACAIWPSLHWDLTLFLGREVYSSASQVQDSDRTISFRDIISINRLPWFIDGHIPDEARKQLLSYLGPIETNGFRHRIHEIMQSAPPPEGSGAFEDWRMHIMVNQLLMGDLDHQTRSQLEEDVKLGMMNNREVDFMVIDYLKKNRKSLDFIVPNRFKEFVFKQSNPLFGFQDWVGLLPWICMGILVLLAPIESWLGKSCHSDMSDRFPIHVTSEEQMYCLRNQEEASQWYRYQVEWWLRHYPDQFISYCVFEHIPYLTEEDLTYTASVAYNLGLKDNDSWLFSFSLGFDTLDQTMQLLAQQGMTSLPCREQLMLSGQIIDANSQQGLSHTLVQSGNYATYSDEEGQFSLYIDTCLGYRPGKLSISTPNYVDQTLDLHAVSDLRNIQASMNLDSLLHPEMVFIPEDSLSFYSNEEAESQIPIGKFWIGKYEVTVGEYLRFCQSTNSHWPEWWEEGNSYHILTGDDDHYQSTGYKGEMNERLPVVGINWEDAQAYSRWLSRETGNQYTLPSDFQWERAVRYAQSLKQINDSKPNPRSTTDLLQVAGTSSQEDFHLYGMENHIWEWINGWTPGFIDEECDLEGSVWYVDGLGRGEDKIRRKGMYQETNKANRGVSHRTFKDRHLGFRVVKLVK